MSRARSRLIESIGTAPQSAVKRGEELFEGNSYPRNWDEYIGQDLAVKDLKIRCKSAKFRAEPLDHVLIASGGHGIGKSSIVRLIAQELGVGLVEVQGALEERDFIRITNQMEEGDILFYDEIHQAVSKGKAKAEWLLSYLQDGHLISPFGIREITPITIIAATTDVQKLPETIISRFPIRPGMDEYTRDQAARIAEVTATKVLTKYNLPTPPEDTYYEIADLAANNPRAVTQILRTLRDCLIAGEIQENPDGTYNLTPVRELLDLTPDGLDDLAQRYLLTLFLKFEGRPAGEKAIAQALGEPVPPRHTEKLLINKGLIQLTPTGRALTEEGLDRAEMLREDQ